MERTAAGDKVEQDGIWLLPDEIIHHILACMKSPKEAAKTIFLSKRWARLWLSYPALEFNGRQFPSREAQQSFATTVLNKFLESDGAPPAEAVRVTMDWLGMGPKPCSAFLDSVFECISKDSPREIYITTSSFDEYDLWCLPPRDLDSGSIIGIHKFQVANHPNLKVFRADGVELEDFMIKEVHSLEIMEVSSRVNGDLQVSSTPNLKLLKCSDEKLNKMINELPHLESLILANLPQIHDLKIVNKDKLRVVELYSWNSEQPGAIEIDAPIRLGVIMELISNPLSCHHST
ncbi:Putative F-box/FBD/LRR-repeat protein At2g05300 [Linum perenne]